MTEENSFEPLKEPEVKVKTDIDMKDGLILPHSDEQMKLPSAYEPKSQNLHFNLGAPRPPTPIKRSEQDQEEEEDPNKAKLAGVIKRDSKFVKPEKVPAVYKGGKDDIPERKEEVKPTENVLKMEEAPVSK